MLKAFTATSAENAWPSESGLAKSRMEAFSPFPLDVTPNVFVPVVVLRAVVPTNEPLDVGAAMTQFPKPVPLFGGGLFFGYVRAW